MTRKIPNLEHYWWTLLMIEVSNPRFHVLVLYCLYQERVQRWYFSETNRTQWFRKDRITRVSVEQSMHMCSYFPSRSMALPDYSLSTDRCLSDRTRKHYFHPSQPSTSGLISTMQWKETFHISRGLISDDRTAFIIPTLSLAYFIYVFFI